MDHGSLFATELEALYQVSRVLSRSLDLKAMLHGVLEALHEHAGMCRGMVSLFDPRIDALRVGAVYATVRSGGAGIEQVRYQAGEGIVGAVLAEGRPLVVPRIAEERRFLGRLGIHDPQLPFVGVPIRVGTEPPIGVLAAQSDGREHLAQRARFLEMVANLIAQSVHLAWRVEQERRMLAAERDRLRSVVRSNYGFERIIGHSALVSQGVV